MEGFTLTFAPLLPWSLAAVLAAATAVVLGVGLRKRSSGIGFRTVAAVALLLALARPTVTAEQRAELADVVLVVADASPSQQLGDRAAATSAAVQALQDGLADEPGLDVRAVTVTGGGPGTKLFAAVRSAVADVPVDGVAAVVLVTDGQVHDVPDAAAALGFDAPVHALLTGGPGERDRRLVVEGAPRYGIVGEAATFRVTLLDEAATGQPEPVRITVPGGPTAERVLQVGTPTEFELPLERAGVVAVALEVAAVPDELTTDNNRVVVQVNAVRDRLRVMLVSGEPSMGLRHWRNLLQADPAVDLVHFTILRPPTKQDATPVQELSLIPFPARELFDANLDDFHLVIFDRYHLRGILPPQYPREHRGVRGPWRCAPRHRRAGLRRSFQPRAHALAGDPPDPAGRGDHRTPVRPGTLGSGAEPPGNRRVRRRCHGMGAVVPDGAGHAREGRIPDARRRRLAAPAAQPRGRGPRGATPLGSVLGLDPARTRRRPAGGTAPPRRPLADEGAGPRGASAAGDRARAARGRGVPERGHPAP